MSRTTFFANNTHFEKELARCCRQYSKLSMYTAWIGNPNAVIPFEYLYNLSEISATVGVSFCQSHPDGIRLLMTLCKDLKIAKDDILFHPKICIFTEQKRKAVFMGSSNFTYHGFYENHEANILIEGISDEKVFADIEADVQKWRSSKYSFKPDEDWLKKYSEQYRKRKAKLKESGIDDESNKEEEVSNSSAWLVKADWDVYMKKVLNGSKKYFDQDRIKERILLLNQVAIELHLPWKTTYFNNLNKRKLIGGMTPFGAFGHVAASGDFRRMLKNGTPQEHKTIVNSINTIANLSYPLDLNKLKIQLNKLVELGPSMKVWGRLLAIVKPELYCTISAPRVRKSIGKTLGKSERYFQDVDGYLMLLSLIHSSPWFNSKPPIKRNELEIWKRRTAFLDVIFY